jgi:hypothetical protein
MINGKTYWSPHMSSQIVRFDRFPSSVQLNHRGIIIFPEIRFFQEVFISLHLAFCGLGKLTRLNQSHP